MERTKRSRPSIVCISSSLFDGRTLSSVGSINFASSVWGKVHLVIQYPGTPRTTREPMIIRGIWRIGYRLSSQMRRPLATRSMSEIARVIMEYFFIAIDYKKDTSFRNIVFIVNSIRLTSRSRSIRLAQYFLCALRTIRLLCEHYLYSIYLFFLSRRMY